jgi:hypothetical protein
VLKNCANLAQIPDHENTKALHSFQNAGLFISATQLYKLGIKEPGIRVSDNSRKYGKSPHWPSLIKGQPLKQRQDVTFSTRRPGRFRTLQIAIDSLEGRGVNPFQHCGEIGGLPQRVKALVRRDIHDD